MVLKKSGSNMVQKYTAHVQNILRINCI